MPLTLTQILPPTRSARTFFIASSLLGLSALMQLGLMGWYLAHGGNERKAVATQAAAPPHFAETMQPTVAPMDNSSVTAPALPTVNVPFADNSVDSQSFSSLLPRPTPVPGQRGASGQASDALEQARALRGRGDMRAALSRLREALVAEPDNPQIIAELALTYEAMQLANQASEQWQRIYGMGESIGALYYLADTKLHTVDPGGSLRRPGAPTQADATVLKITDINAEEIPDPSVEQKVALKIVVKSRPGLVIDPEKVKIEAYFYDLVDGTDMVQTDAQTDFAWLSPPPINWANDKSEVLEALYVRPKGVALMPGAAPAATRGGASSTSRRRNGRNDRSKSSPAPDAVEPSPSPAEMPAPPARKYLGYSVRLYYNGNLQEVQADPVRLLERFQAPLTLPADDGSAR